MKVKALGVTVIGLFSFLTAFTQAPLDNNSFTAEQVKLRDYLPPSPELSTLQNNIQLSSSLQNGSAQSNVPIHELAIGKFKIPITLNYSSNGSKRDEMPSRTGVGWNLIAGGSITRIIQGKDDFTCSETFEPMNMENLTFEGNTTLFQYLLNLTDKSIPIDGMPDEYRYNFNGYSGKFYIKRDGVSVINIPYNGLKFDVHKIGQVLDWVMITDLNGVKYYFGYNQEYEQTKLTASYIQSMLDRVPKRTGWMLSKIELPSGELVQYEYDLITVNKVTNTNNVLNKHYQPIPFMVVKCENTPPSGTTTVNDISADNDSSFAHHAMQMQYTTQCIKQIIVSGGPGTNNSLESAYFYYKNRSEGTASDQSDERYLTEIKVVENSSNRQVKQVTFDYTFHEPEPELNYAKFYLNAVNTKSNQAGDDQTIRYAFEYYQGLTSEFYEPQGQDNGTDFLGFYNRDGSKSKKEYIQGPMPQEDFPQAHIFKSSIMGKFPNGTAAQNGMLKKITFPTGGEQVLHYEPNLLTKKDWVPNLEYHRAHLSGTGVNTYSTTFSCNYSGPFESYFRVNWNGAGAPPPVNNENGWPEVIGEGMSGPLGGLSGNEIPTGNLPLPESITAIGYLYEAASNVLVNKWLVRGYAGFPGYQLFSNKAPENNRLQAGIDYVFKLEVRYDNALYQYNAVADLVYATNLGFEYKKLEEELCGNRVKQIDSYDPVSKQTTSKYFHYKNVLSPDPDEVPSAQKLYRPEFVKASLFAKKCIQIDYMTGTSIIITNECPFALFTSNSIVPTEINQGTGVVYEYIAESDDPTFAHGGILHKYSFKDITQLYMDETRFGLFRNTDRLVDPYDYMSGLELETIYFDQDFFVVKKVSNEYIEDPSPGVSDMLANNHKVERMFDVPYSLPPAAMSFNPFYLAEYTIRTGWVHLCTSTTIDYDKTNGTEHSVSTSYEYNAENLQPKDVKIGLNDGNQISKFTYYPFDNPTNPVCSTMIARRIFTPVISEKQYKNNTLIYHRKIDYNDWRNEHKIFEPKEELYAKGDGNLETRVEFADYNNRGNLLELNKVNDVSTSYLWDHGGYFLVAEIKNASIKNQETAYTSFETVNDNGWDVTSSARVNASSVTGSKSYSLASGSIVLNGSLPQKSYYVTYWLKNESGSASIGSSSGEILANKQGWKLMRHKFTNITQLPPLTGSGTIDELRLYPVGAFMKTITYLPGVGISSMSDENSIYQRYEYDGFNRLILIRDWDNNIVKKATYKLQEEIAPCLQTTPNWQPTGELRCAINNVINNAHTGVQEREEIDQNNCSATYLQRRWTATGINSTACPVENCNTPNYRMVNGVCMPGERLLLRSEYKGNMQWKCYFHYQWPDGFHTEEMTEYSNQPCIN